MNARVMLLLPALLAVPAAADAAVVDFGERLWMVREHFGGPGENQWSTNCVWKDAAGRLHLQVKESGGQWYCGEVETERSAGYGEYRWQTTGRLDNLDPNIVAGLFTFGAPYGTNEIDFEFTYGFDPVTNNLHYTVHPWYWPGHMYKARVSQAAADMTHSFAWRPGRIRWHSWYGHSAAPSNAEAVIADWTYEGEDVPADAHEHVYINCWIVNHTAVTINESNAFQSIEGFGASLTDSSAYLLRYGLTGAERTNVLRALFSPAAGIGLNILRQPIGASDFRLQNYTYNDRPAGQADYGLTNFSIARDETYIIPLVQAVSGIQTNLRIFGTPWSAPAWMKDSASLYCGSLRADAYDAYAAYFRKYVQAYAAHGLAIHAVTLQNEPLYQPYWYPGMYMSPADQARLARLVGEQFRTNGIATRILCYDHNWDEYGYPLAVLGDTGAAAVVAGSAFHAYGGAVSAQSAVHSARPDKDIYFTEATCVNWYSNFSDNLMWDAANLLVGALTHWSRTVIKWNLALDPGGGPKLGGGCDGCTGILTVNTNTHAVTTNVDYYSLGHASKFIRRGARRIETVETKDVGPYTVAFRNPDSNFVLIAYNSLRATRLFTFRWRQEKLDYALPGRSLATFTWPNRAGATADVWLTTGDRRCLLQIQTNSPVFRPVAAAWTSLPAAELVVADFSFTPLAGTNLFDEFDDGVRGGAWYTCGDFDYASDELVETNGMLRVHPVNNNWFAAGYCSDLEIDRPREGFETVFSASLRTVTVTQANAGGGAPADMRVFLSVFNDYTQCDPYWVSNAITLRGGYDGATDSLRVELFTKAGARESDGTRRFDGSISGLAAYGDTNGLDLQIVLKSSNYALRILRQGAEVPIVTASGSKTGPLNMGHGLDACRMFLGGGNQDQGRGYVYWNRASITIVPESPVTGSVPAASTVWLGVSSSVTFSASARTGGMEFAWSVDHAVVQRDAGSASSFLLTATPEFLGPHTIGLTVQGGPNTVFTREWLVVVGAGDPGLLLHWPFDSDGRDLSGWGNEIPINNDAAIGWDGVSGHALELEPSP